MIVVASVWTRCGPLPERLLMVSTRVVVRPPGMTGTGQVNWKSMTPKLFWVWAVQSVPAPADMEKFWVGSTSIVMVARAEGSEPRLDTVIRTLAVSKFWEVTVIDVARSGGPATDAPLTWKSADWVTWLLSVKEAVMAEEY